MNSMHILRINDKACTICDGIYSNGRAISKKRCDECINDNKVKFKVKRYAS